MFADEEHNTTVTTPELATSIAQKLRERTYECTVCTDIVGYGDALWACTKCFGVFHLPCINYWAKNQPTTDNKEAPSATDGSGPQFRCPLCQAPNPVSTTETWQCFCGKTESPKVEPDLIPSSCGAVCGKRRGPFCPHQCTSLCHPGPCAECPLQRKIFCHCGKDTKLVACSSTESTFCCEDVCEKLLDCGRHRCEYKCHEGECTSCSRTRSATCYCGAVTQPDRMCTSEDQFSCRGPCPRMKDCGKHQCEQKCHAGGCGPCERDPKTQTTCCCGKVPLWKLHHADKTLETRTSCEDPIPSCGDVCGKLLPCGHRCPQICHDSPCPPCLVVKPTYCRCKGSKKPIVCFTKYLGGDNEEWLRVAEQQGIQRKFVPKQYPLVCEKYCGKKLNCGRHKCENVCCGETEESHICMQVCRRRAPCGIHECGQLCHRGPCPRCQHTSFDPLYCRCRRSVIEPPIPCGTAPPLCNHPCIVPRPCGHPSNHNCHPEDIDCPECVVLVEKRCASHGEVQPYFHSCNVKVVSCGKPCGKECPACKQQCIAVCHAGPCPHVCPGPPQVGPIDE